MKILLFPRFYRYQGIALLMLSGISYGHEFSFLETKPRHIAQDEIVDLGTLMTNNNLTDEVAYAGILIGLFMIGFARLKNEDEYTIQIRLRSLNLTFYLSYLAVIVITFLSYGMNYLLLLAEFVVLLRVLYIVILNYNLYVHPRVFRKVL